MRLFNLHRTVDATGTSGTGVVAQGVIFDDGTVALRWSTTGQPHTTVLFDSIRDVEAIHGHNGATNVVYTDGLDNERRLFDQRLDDLRKEFMRLLDAVERDNIRLRKPFGGPRPPIVVLCGSTRFYDDFQEANYELTMQGAIVLSVGFYPHAKAKHGHGEGVGHDSAEKVALDELHKRKIDLADRVFVLDVGGYIGESTRSEIEYAESIGRPIVYLSDMLDERRQRELDAEIDAAGGPEEVERARV